MSRVPHRRRGGFATFVAVAMILLVGAALSALSSLLMVEARRTRRQVVDAQIRQHLLAGAVAARGHVARQGPAAARFVHGVPALDAGQPGTIEVRIEPEAEPGRAQVRIEAALGPHRGQQTLQLADVDGRWRVVGARLGP